MACTLRLLASLAGVVLISTVDLSGHSDKDRGSFPHKSTSEMALGDFMAFLSALLYGLYVTVMKRRVGNEDRVDMQLFFGLVGVFNIMFLWPLFFVLHWSGLETVSYAEEAAWAEEADISTSLSCRRRARCGLSSSPTRCRRLSATYRGRTPCC